jgi:sugar phosphate isomerase/epimerase
MHRRSFITTLLLTAANTAAASTRIAASQLTASTACLAGFSFAECLHKLRQLGFRGVEILTYTGASHSVGPIPGAVVAELGASEKMRLRRTLGDFRSVSTHLPFHNLFLAAQDSQIRQSAQDRIYEAVEDSGFWGASIATAHAAAEPGQALADARRELIPFFRRLGDLAAKRSMRIGLKRAGRTPLRITSR